MEARIRKAKSYRLYMMDISYLYFDSCLFKFIAHEKLPVSVLQWKYIPIIP